MSASGEVLQQRPRRVVVLAEQLAQVLERLHLLVGHRVRSLGESTGRWFFKDGAVVASFNFAITARTPLNWTLLDFFVPSSSAKRRTL
jgi:hypothetical protein